MVDGLEKKIRSAWRRLLVNRFFAVLVPSMSLAFVAGCGIVLVDKFLEPRLSPWWVLLTSVACGLALAAGWTWKTRRSPLHAALALDQGLGLAERISTLQALDPLQSQSPAGAALRRDVTAQLDRIDVRAAVPFVPPRRSWLAAATFGVLVGLLVFVGPLDLLGKASAKAVSEQERQQIAKQTELLEKRLEERQSELANQGLDEEFAELNRQLDQLQKKLQENPQAGVKQAAAELADLAKSLEERRSRLDSADRVRQALEKLPNGSEGPAEKLAQAMRDGDLDAAQQEMEQLQQQLAEGKLDEAQRQQLAEQLSQLSEQMQSLADLSERAEQLLQNLPPELSEAELQKLLADAEKLKQLKEMAEKFGECSQCMKSGEDGDLMMSMEEAKEMLERLGEDQKRLEALTMLRNELDACRQGMCQNPSQVPGKGWGRGSHESQPVKVPDEIPGEDVALSGKTGSGNAFVTGTVRGNRFKGESRIEIQDAAQAAAQAADDPLTHQKVPPEYRDHAKDYFQQLNRNLQPPPSGANSNVPQ